MVLVACIGCGTSEYVDELIDECDSLGNFDVSSGSLVAASCDELSGLCTSPVRSSIVEPDLARAVDLVFVGDGFTELDTYRAHVDQIVARLQSIDDVAAKFNVHVVDVVSPSTNLLNGSPKDTALGGCMRRDPLAGDWWLYADPTLVSAAANSAPDADVVAVVLNVIEGRANAEIGSGPVETPEGWIRPLEPRGLRISLADSAETLLHEIGHALFGLGDEYGELDRAFVPLWKFSTDGDPLVPPNVSLDANGAKWRDIVEGARVGGLRHRSGIYHPTATCRMNRSRDPFCLVCRDRIGRVLDAFDRAPDDGAPRCALHLAQSPDAVRDMLLVALVGYDENFAVLGDVVLDDSVLLDAKLSVRPRSFDLLAIRVVDTKQLANGPHVLRGQCLDGTGEVTEVVLPFTIAN